MTRDPPPSDAARSFDVPSLDAVRAVALPTPEDVRRYEPPSLAEFREVRRTLPLLAGVLLLVAPLFPMWEIWVYAVQYPDTVLHLELYAYPRIAGDYVEMHRLNKYIGFYYPDPVYWQPNYEPHPDAIDVPEWSFGPAVFVALAGAGLFVAAAPSSEKLKQGLRWQFVGSIVVLAVMLADIQYRLYQAGHNLDPDSPVMGVEGFTPPLWGKYQVANITSYSRFGPGAYITMAAILLLAVAFYYRDTAITFSDLPVRLAARLGLVDRDGSDGDPGPDGGDGANGGIDAAAPSVAPPAGHYGPVILPASGSPVEDRAAVEPRSSGDGPAAGGDRRPGGDHPGGTAPSVGDGPPPGRGADAPRR